MTTIPEIRLHNGMLVPESMISTVVQWDQADVTPGWLDELPATIEAFANTWKIEIDPTIPRSGVTLVLLGHSKELGPVVIKSSPMAAEFRSEATALDLAKSPNVSALYDVDFDRSTMVVERIMPGTQLKDIDMADDLATRLAAETVQTMWHPVSDISGLHELRTWMRELFEWTSNPEFVPDDLIAHAQRIGDELLVNSRRNVLLHGDFHHENLLLRESGEWAIIDPKGLYGDPGFEIAAWIYNPEGMSSRPDVLEVVRRRLTIMSEVWGIDRDELAAWAFVGAVLSSCWSANDPTPSEWLNATVTAASNLQTLLP